MIGLEDRRQMAALIQEAHGNGARLQQACEAVGITVRTLQRWQDDEGLIKPDARPEAVRPTPGHALSEAERAEVLRVANEPRFADLPPARIVPALADEGRYLASESTFCRLLRAHGQNAHRGRARAPQPGHDGRSPTHSQRALSIVTSRSSADQMSGEHGRVHCRWWIDPWHSWICRSR